MDSPCIKQTVCKVLKIFQCGKYLVAYVLNPFTTHRSAYIHGEAYIANSMDPDQTEEQSDQDS